MQKLVQDKKRELSSAVQKKLKVARDQLVKSQYSAEFKEIIEQVSTMYKVNTNVTYAAWNSFLTNGSNQPKYIREIVDCILSKLKTAVQ